MKEGKKERVVSDTPTRFRAHMPPIMEKKTARNNLRRRTTIIDN
jgi:hypothetical protein